ncbi:FecR domain-containing protein [Ferruginibacter paludis]|uniref:FecR family protein n=1 Tax=Ferruginibacter paludis TaxID=1310417 RepID=UPI0025B36C8C|nr:FecR domain-containing protein [Ferruginibacter paludis]MDN3654015.1 FecR domain-containing protein [Ferruginibacter paludis]
MDYTEFSTTDLICDEYFQNWVIKPDRETDEFWSSWVLQHPERSQIIEEAKNVLLHIKFKEHLPTLEEMQNSLASTLSIINKLGELRENRKVKIVQLLGVNKILKIAAIFIAASLTGGIVYYTYWNAKTTISAMYGETKKVVLPDGSQVVLNAHSTISYFTHVRKNRPRQIWLEGEAFFKINHINKDENDIKESERFIVSTNDLVVKVLGTSFDVKRRNQITEVILETGKIMVEFNNKFQASVNMLPGQMITYDNSSPPLLKSVDPANYTTWINKKLVLKDASVTEIAQYIQDYYGYKVILQDTAIGNKKMEGILLLNDMKDVLFVLSNTLNVKIEKQGNTLIFKNRK